VVVKGGVLGVLVRREEGLHWLHERGLDTELGLCWDSTWEA